MKCTRTSFLEKVSLKRPAKFTGAVADGLWDDVRILGFLTHLNMLKARDFRVVVSFSADGSGDLFSNPGDVSLG